MKLCRIFISVFLMIALLPVNVFATSTAQTPENIIYYDDGSYIIVETNFIETRDTFTRNANRVYTYYNINGVKKWEATLVATFTYNGTSCTCASSSLFVNIQDDAWYVVSKEESKSGNTASADLVMGYKFLGITTTKKTISMSITCDKDGNLS